MILGSSPTLLVFAGRHGASYLAEILLKEHKNSISSLIIIPSSDGVFEVKLNDELIFSKKSLGRFPEEGEVEKLLR
jgi:selenoprotein W-related protein